MAFQEETIRHIMDRVSNKRQFTQTSASPPPLTKSSLKASSPQPIGDRRLAALKTGGMMKTGTITPPIADRMTIPTAEKTAAFSGAEKKEPTNNPNPLAARAADRAVRTAAQGCGRSAEPEARTGAEYIVPLTVKDRIERNRR